MRQRLQRLDPGFLAVLAIAALALWPFLSRPGLPRFTDAELHVYRLAELARLVAAGEFYPRWAPNFYFGYGYPIFNYYAPLSYYAGLPVALLPWWDAVDGVRAVFILGVLLGALGTYAFVRVYWGRSGALVAAAAYAFAPYVLYVDPHARGDLAETFGMSLLPPALWALDRLRRRSAGAWLLAVALVAAVILSHNLLALASFALLLVWTVWECAGREGSRAVCGLRLGALLVGVALAAFFWLPVALEQEAVNLNTLIGDGGHFDYRNHFLSVAGLLGPPGRLDWGATEAAFRLNLGLPQWLLALAAVLLLTLRQVRAPRRALFFALAALVLLAMMLPLSAPVWARVPLLPYFQFPWRLLALAAPVLAVLGGIAAEALVRQLGGRAARWLPALLVGLIILAGLPLLQVPPWSGEAWDTSVAGVLAEEMRGRWLGTTSTADFVPATVDVIPRPTEQVVEAMRANEIPDRVNRATLPPGTTVRAEQVRPLLARYVVSSAEPFPLRLFQFAFPGWEARVDGEPVATEVGRPEGFLVIPVPAGEHVVEVALRATPPQRAAWLVSALAALVAGAVALWLHRRRPAAQPAAAPVSDAPAGPVLAAVAAAALLYGLLAAGGWLHVESSGYQAIPAEHDLFASLNGEIALIGYDAPEEAHAGQTVTVTLYWKAQRAAAENYQVFVHLLWPDGTIVTQSDKLNPGEFPTRRWPLDRYVRDQHRLMLPPDLPPDDYRLTAGLWLQAEGERLPVVDDMGQPLDDVVTLGSVTIGE
ncbi:MAG: hypothetical protein GX579_09825 [Chloroflexi bacterium]|nr:hypothetical protein [Chloroflexota bacterium]